MNHRHLLRSSIVAFSNFIVITAGAMTGQLVPLTGLTAVPQEKFRVVVQKEPKTQDVRFYYVFASTSEFDTRPLDSVASPIKYLHSTRNSVQFSNGFSKLIKSRQGTVGNPPRFDEYVRLFVINTQNAGVAKPALQAKLDNREQEALIIASQPVKRIPDPAKITTCRNLSTGWVVDGKLIFTVTQTGEGQDKKIEITVKDERRCKKSLLTKAKIDTQERARALGQTVKEKASSAWSSTKQAASRAKASVSSAATRAKESVTKRFGKK